MDKMSGGTFSKVQDTDLKAVIAERDALRKELEQLELQFSELYATVREIVDAKDEFMALANRLLQENMALKAALGHTADNFRVKN